MNGIGRRSGRFAFSEKLQRNARCRPQHSDTSIASRPPLRRYINWKRSRKVQAMEKINYISIIDCSGGRSASIHGSTEKRMHRKSSRQPFITLVGAHEVFRFPLPGRLPGGKHLAAPKRSAAAHSLQPAPPQRKQSAGKRLQHFHLLAPGRSRKIIINIMLIQLNQRLLPRKSR